MTKIEPDLERMRLTIRNAIQVRIFGAGDLLGWTQYRGEAVERIWDIVKDVHHRNRSAQAKDRDGETSS